MANGRENAIIIEDVHKSFGDVEALAGVSLTAWAGRIFGLLGPNGAGKTTLVRILTTLLQPDSGRVEVAGVDVLRNPAGLREIIGLAGQYPAVDEHLTGRENLDMVARLYHFDGNFAKRRADELLERFSLTDAANRPVKTYSGGMRRRLDLAASIVAKPRVLFLDEPTTGLDPRTRIEMWEVIRELVRDGATLLLTTQYLEEADELANYIAVIDHGKVIAEGTSDELKSLLGSDVLEVKVAHKNDLNPALESVKALASESPQIFPEKGAFAMSVPNGTKSLMEAVRKLDAANIELDDLNLRRPTLDDVFLSITGKTSTQEAPAVTVAS